MKFKQSTGIEIFKFTSHQENANRNHNEVSPQPVRMTVTRKSKTANAGGNGNCATIMENAMKIPKISENSLP